jgi:hypothetical protein
LNAFNTFLASYSLPRPWTVVNIFLPFRCWIPVYGTKDACQLMTLWRYTPSFQGGQRTYGYESCLILEVLREQAFRNPTLHQSRHRRTGLETDQGSAQSSVQSSSSGGWLGNDDRSSPRLFKLSIPPAGASFFLV